MDRGAWRAESMGLQRVGHDWAINTVTFNVKLKLTIPTGGSRTSVIDPGHWSYKQKVSTPNAEAPPTRQVRQTPCDGSAEHTRARLHRESCSADMSLFLAWSKLALEKAEELEIKLPTSAESLKKQESFRKTSISAWLTMPKPLTVSITINCGKFWKRWEYQTTWPASWETCMQVRKQQLELDMKQQTGSK